ncbi:MAG: AAA family ATPase [bacterium]
MNAQPGAHALPFLPRARSHWLAVVGGKGGVGKTHVAASLAHAWAAAGERVLLVDADLGLGNVEILLGLRPRFDLADAITGRVSLSDVVVQAPNGVHVLPAGSGSLDLATFTLPERARLTASLTALGHLYDRVVLDVGAGIGPVVLFFQGLAHETLVVTHAEPTALTDAYAFVKVAYRANATRRFRLLVNQARDGEDATRAHRVIEELAQRFLGVAVDDAGAIPYDAQVGRAVRLQKVVVESNPTCPASHALERLARTLLSHDSAGSATTAHRHVPGKAR